MSNMTERDTCDICKTYTYVKRQYYIYDEICDCCSPKHFEVVRHCAECTPKPPKHTSITYTLEQLAPAGYTPPVDKEPELPEVEV